MRGNPSTMSKFVLVHGSWHGGWCWGKLAPLLEAEGHDVVCPDLLGHGKDRARPVARFGLKDYAQQIAKLIERQDSKVILVGHSMGGTVVSQAAEYVPEKIRSIVYLCAYLLRNGESLLPIALTDAESLIGKNLIVDEIAGTHRVREKALRAALYQDCSEQDAKWASSLLVPESNAVVTSPFSLSGKRYGSVDRVYIETLQDKGVTISLQRKMCSASPCRKVFSLDSGHSPFLSMPDALAKVLLKL